MTKGDYKKAHAIMHKIENVETELSRLKSMKYEITVAPVDAPHKFVIVEGKTKDKIIAAIKEDREAKIAKYNAQLETL